MFSDIHKIRSGLLLSAVETFLTLRALWFAGFRYQCPCCGWRLRAFTMGGSSLQLREKGYCPRCNSKARHRRDWLYIAENTNLFTEYTRLLHISPKYSLSRRFASMDNIRYVGIDISPRQNINSIADITKIPLQSNTFDAVICIHVMEEVVQDRKAMRELHRVLKSGGWAFITVPTNLDTTTYEDPTITKPKERELAFGEEAHVRIYGYDLIDRLESCGFQVSLDMNIEIEPEIRDKYGLLTDENVFFCIK